MAKFAELEIAADFWEMIATANRSQKRLRTLLMSVDQDELVRFHNEFEYMVSDLVDHVGAHDGDAFHEEDVAGWVVSQGITHFAQVWDNPAKFPDDVPSRRASLKGIAYVVWEQRFGTSSMHRHQVGRWPTSFGSEVLRRVLAESGTEPGSAR